MSLVFIAVHLSYAAVVLFSFFSFQYFMFTVHCRYADGDDVLYDSKAVLRPKSSIPNGRSKSSSSQRSSRSSIRSAEDLKTTPEPVIRAKVKKKLKKHEQRQDELFSL